MKTTVIHKNFEAISTVGTTNYKKTLSAITESKAVSYLLMANDCLSLACDYVNEAVKTDWGENQYCDELNTFYDIICNAGLEVEKWLGRSVCLVMGDASRPQTVFDKEKEK